MLRRSLCAQRSVFGSLVEGTPCSAFTTAFLCRVCMDSMPLLCICGAKSPFAIVFPVVRFIPPSVHLLNHHLGALSPGLSLCTVLICCSCWQY